MNKPQQPIPISPEELGQLYECRLVMMVEEKPHCNVYHQVILSPQQMMEITKILYATVPPAAEVYNGILLRVGREAVKLPENYRSFYI